MSATCPNGHLSATTNYCDHCGAPLGSQAPGVAAADPAAQPAPPERAEVEASPDTTPSQPAEPCPQCETPRVGSDRFCEGC